MPKTAEENDKFSIHARVIARIGLSMIFVLAAFYIFFFREHDQQLQKLAWFLVGSLAGYWLGPPR